MNKTNSILLSLIAIGGWSVAANRPNVIVIMTDDLGYGDLGCYGNKIVDTKNLDQFAHDNVLLQSHYSAAPISAPSRAGFLTGQFPQKVGAVDVPSNRGLDRICLSDKTMADLFKENGYATAMIGKWHNGAHDMRYHPMNRGFQRFYGFLNGGMDYYNWILDCNGAPVKSDGRHLTDVFTDEAISYVKQHKSNPFFLYLAYNAPHTPLQAPDSLIQKYKNKGKLTSAVATTYAMIEQMDINIGRLFDTIKALMLEQNTIILFTSDNGPVFGGRGESNLTRYNCGLAGSKYFATEGGIRVPGIVSFPALLKKGEIYSPITFYDWMPTFSKLCGLKANPKDRKKWDGTEISEQLKQQSNSDRTIFWQYNRYIPIEFSNSAVRQGNWKLVWKYRVGTNLKDKADNIEYEYACRHEHQLKGITKGLPVFEVGAVEKPALYNISDDPCEKNDLSVKYPDMVSELTKLYEVWFKKMIKQYQIARMKNTQ